MLCPERNLLSFFLTSLAGMLMTGGAAFTDEIPDAEITFIHVGDTHYNARGENFEAQRERYRQVIKSMNAIPGTSYPGGVGGEVGEPMGVFVVGDLTESKESDFEVFIKDWGLKGADGLLNYPVYEGAGNHDGPPSTRDGVVRQRIIERNPKRPHLESLCERDLHYSLKYKGVHFIQLNEYAGLDDDQRYPGNPEYNRKGQAYGNPSEKSLQFLERTLAENVEDSDRPVILFQHYGFDGWSLHPWGGEMGWWTEEHALRLWEVIKPYNVISIHVGHDHSHNIMRWHGIPVYHMDAGSYALYRIKDGEMIRAVRHPLGDEDNWGRVDGRQSTSVASGLPHELVQGPYLVYEDDPSKMTVLWRTEEAMDVRFRWGREQFRYELGTKTVQPHDEEYNLYRQTITDLKSNTRYSYELKIGDKHVPGMFYSAPARDADKVKFLIYGHTDAGLAEHENIAAALYDKIYEDPAYYSLLVHTGNWLPKDNRLDRIELWDQQFFARTDKMRHPRYTRRRLPLMGAVGQRQGNTDLFRKLFPYNFQNGNYHSFQYGPAHITIMDPYEDYSENSSQHEWLANDLEQAKAPWKILVFNGPKPRSQESPRDLLEPLCEKYEVDLIIDGNRGEYRKGSFDAFEYVKPGSTASRKDETPHTLHYGAVTIEGRTLQFDIFNDKGEEIDSLSINKE